MFHVNFSRSLHTNIPINIIHSLHECTMIIPVAHTDVHSQAVSILYKQYICMYNMCVYICMYIYIYTYICTCVFFYCVIFVSVG